MHRIRITRLLALLLVAVVVVSPVQAHEHREVGDYLINFGWRVEPAYAGVYNGPELTITRHDTEEPVPGLAETLNLHVTLGGDTQSLRLYERFGQPGRYTADLIPTRPGDYSFHLFGTIGETQVDETFTSADGQFSPVEPMSDIAFPPLATADMADLQAQIADLQAQIDALRAELEALRGQ